MKTFSQLVKEINEAKYEWPASLTPGTKEYKAKQQGSKDGDGSRHKIEKEPGIVRATRKYDADSGESEEPTKNRENAAEAHAKRGRGRPPGKYGSYKKKLKESLEILESLETQEEIEEFISSLDQESFEELEAHIDEELHPNQRVLDKNKNNKLDKEDFKMLRGEKQAKMEEVDLDESSFEKELKDLQRRRKEYQRSVDMGHYGSTDGTGLNKQEYEKRVKELQRRYNKFQTNINMYGHLGESVEEDTQLQEAVAVTTKPGISVKKEKGRTPAVSTHHVVDGHHYKVTSQHDGDDGLYHDIHKVSGKKETRVHTSYKYGVGGYDSPSKPERGGTLDKKVASSLYSAHDRERKKKVHGDTGKHSHELHDDLDESLSNNINKEQIDESVNRYAAFIATENK